MERDPRVNPIKVLFDGRILGVAMTDIRARTGIFRVVEETLDRLVQDKDFSIQIFDSSGSYFCCQAFVHENRKSGYVLFRGSNFWKLKLVVRKMVKAVLVRFAFPGYFRDFMVALKQFYIGSAGRRAGSELSGFQVYHTPSAQVPASIRNIKGIVKVVEVHDLIPVLYPQFLDPEALHGGKHPIHETIDDLNADDFVICNSAWDRSDLFTYRKDLVPERVCVAPLAASSKFFPVKDLARIEAIRQRYKIPAGKKYILSVCTLEPRKNLEAVVRAFNMFVEERKIEDVVLVLVGAAGWKCEPLLRQVGEVGELAKKIIFTGFVPDEDLAALYSGALVFAYFSFYEGFGLPPLEAMQCGTPVITSNTSSLPEVVGDAGVMIDPRDEKGAREHFFHFYNDPVYREEFSRKALLQAGRFSWDIHCDVVKQVYRQALDKVAAPARYS